MSLIVNFILLYLFTLYLVFFLIYRLNKFTFIFSIKLLKIVQDIKIIILNLNLLSKNIISSKY